MATTAIRVKARMKPKFGVRGHHRCRRCGRPRAFMRKFQVCRICFRELASEGKIPGVIRASW